MEEASENVLVEYDPAAKRGYWLALVGAIAGTFIALSGFLFIVSVIGIVTIDWFPPGSSPLSLGLILYGQFVAAMLGMAVGIAGALAIGQRAAPILTGLLSIPAALIVFVVMYGLGQVIDTMDIGWLLIVPPLIIPFLARLTALWLKFGSGSPQF